jgi:hypothetical protein
LQMCVLLSQDMSIFSPRMHIFAPFHKYCILLCYLKRSIVRLIFLFPALFTALANCLPT